MEFKKLENPLKDLVNLEQKMDNFLREPESLEAMEMFYGAFYLLRVKLGLERVSVQKTLDYIYLHSIELEGALSVLIEDQGECE